MTTAIRTRRNTVLVAALAASLFSCLWFAHSSSVNAGIISEGFPSDGNYPSGTLVSIRNTIPTTIELASVLNSDYLLGVVERTGDSLLSFSDGMDDVAVTTIGQAEAFVSDVNGDIKIGDFIGASWIKGVGMKANSEVQQKLLGIAIEDFSEAATNVVLARDIETPSGKKDARIGKIAIRLFNKEVGPDVNDGRSSLENFASRVAGKDVAFVRVVASAGLFVVTVLISSVFLANAIKGSFISIGRNPLSSASVFNSLMHISGVSIGLLLIGAVIAYVVLVV